MIDLIIASLSVFWWELSELNYIKLLQLWSFYCSSPPEPVNQVLTATTANKYKLHGSKTIGFGALINSSGQKSQIVALATQIPLGNIAELWGASCSDLGVSSNLGCSLLVTISSVLTCIHSLCAGLLLAPLPFWWGHQWMDSGPSLFSRISIYLEPQPEAPSKHHFGRNLSIQYGTI